LDRQFAVPAVDENGESNGRRSAQVAQGIHRRPHRAAGEKHVVHKHQLHAVYRKRNVGTA
jgi:hypothetical protein